MAESPSFLDIATKVVGFVAGLVALALALLDLLKKYRENESDLADLWRQRRTRAALAIAAAGVLLISGTIWYSLRPGATTGKGIERIPFPAATASVSNGSVSRETVAQMSSMNVQVFDILNGRPHTVVASRIFGLNGPLADAATMRPVTAWITTALAPKTALVPIEVFVRVPGDLSKERIGIATRPDVSLDAYYYDVRYNSKSRVPLPVGDPTRLNPGQDYVLELTRDGYPPMQIVIPWKHQPYDLRRTMTPNGIRVIVKPGSNNATKSRVAAQTLSTVLTGDARFVVMSPDTLDALNRDTSTGAARYDPMVQSAVRQDDRVDRVITIDVTDTTVAA